MDASESAANLMAAVRAGVSAEELTRRFAGRAIVDDVVLDRLDYPHHFDLTGCCFRGRFSAAEARFGRSVVLNRCRFERGLVLESADVAINLEVEEATAQPLPELVSDKIVAIDARQASVGRRASFRLMAASGSLLFWDISVNGDCVFDAIRLSKDCDLILTDCEIGGSLFCQTQKADAPQPVIGGTLSLNGGRVVGDIDLSGAIITGWINLFNCQIGCNLTCEAPWETTPPMVIDGWLDISGATISGSVSLYGADIGRNLPPGQSAIIATRTDIDDGLFIGSIPGRYDCDRPTTIHGRIELTHLTTHGDLSLVGVAVPASVNLHAVKVTGDLLALRNGDYPTTLGRIDASNLSVTGNVSFKGAELACHPTKDADGPPRPCLDLRFATITGRCDLPAGSKDSRRLHLDHADLGDVTFAGPDLPTVQLDGAKFRLLTVPGDDYGRFLDHTAPFLRGNYETVEDYLRERGYDDTADHVYREMRRRDRREADPSYTPRFWGRVGRRWFRAADWLNDKITGYSTKSYRIGLFLFGAFVFSLGLFAHEHSVKRAFTPTAVELRDHPELAEQERYPAEVGKTWRFPDVVSMAARTVVPYIDLAVDGDWQPASNRSFPDTVAQQFGYRVTSEWLREWTSYENIAGLVRGLCYAAIPLFLVSASRLLKRRGE